MRGIGPRGLSSSQVSQWHGAPSIIVPANDVAPIPPIVIVDSFPATGEGKTELTPAYSGAVAGDVIVAISNPRYGNVLAATSSGLTFTEITKSGSAGAWYAIQPDSTGRTVTLAHDSGPTEMSAILLVIRNVDNDTPMDGTALNVAISTTTPSITGPTTSVSGSMVFGFAKAVDDTTMTCTASGWTALWQANYSAYLTYSLVYKVITPAGAAGSITWSQTAGESGVALAWGVRRDIT